MFFKIAGVDGDGHRKPTRDMTHELIEMIRQSSRRINDRVKEIADSVKGLTRPPQFAPCRLADVVSNVYRTLRILADERHVALREEGIDSLPVIRADESRLFNAIYNLVNNAIPEVPAGGSVDGLRGARMNRKSILCCR